MGADAIFEPCGPIRVCWIKVGDDFGPRNLGSSVKSLTQNEVDAFSSYFADGQTDRYREAHFKSSFRNLIIIILFRKKEKRKKSINHDDVIYKYESVLIR